MTERPRIWCELCGIVTQRYVEEQCPHSDCFMATPMEEIMPDWQTLDNAPKDGSKFLANTCDFENGTPFNRCVQEARWSGKTPEDRIGCFTSKNGQMVTHWMPLPTDPLCRAYGEHAREK